MSIFGVIESFFSRENIKKKNRLTHVSPSPSTDQPSYGPRPTRNYLFPAERGFRMGEKVTEVHFEIGDDEVPNLVVNGEKVGVVSLTYSYVTQSSVDEGTNLMVAGYISRKNREQKFISFDRLTGEIFNQ